MIGTMGPLLVGAGLRNGLSSDVTALLRNPSGFGARTGALTAAGTDDTAVRKLPALGLGAGDAAVELADGVVELTDAAVEVTDGVPVGVADLAATLAVDDDAAESLDFVVAEGFGVRVALALAVPVARGPACATDEDPPEVDPAAEEADEDESEELPVESAAAIP